MKAIDKEHNELLSTNAELQQHNVSLQLRDHNMTNDLSDLQNTNENLMMQIEDLAAKLRENEELREGLMRQLQQWKDTNSNLEEHLKYYMVHKDKT